MDCILSHKKRLIGKYGEKGFSSIDTGLRVLVELTKGELIYIDESGGDVGGFDFTKKIHQKRVKEFIDALDLMYEGENSFLFIGGNDIIPFYSLENPTEDDDKEILTDSPYASRDDDFLIPQRSVGRIPDSIEKGKGFLTETIDRMVVYHKELKSDGGSFGYSASSWKDSSREVFKTVGKEKDVQVSPPLTHADIVEKQVEKEILYFNLHGSKETPNWYGQRSHDDDAGFPMYPVAFTPENVSPQRRSCVYTEACYGAWIFNKKVEESLSLTFLSQGAIAFIGSTAIAYGPPKPPLREADLLGKYILQNVKKGITFGEVLRRAKVDFAKEMIKIQGFLDDDDKKTLLEFQLFGDPTLRIPPENQNLP
jgi:hypothetical protein